MTRKDIMNRVYNAYYSSYPASFKRLYNCKAIIVHVEYSEWLILKSYEKVVAAFQVSTGILWAFGFYSSTTAQHVAKFCKWLRNEYNIGWNYQRTVKAGTVARVKYARFNDDFSVESGEMVKQFDGVLDAEKVEKALHNAEPCTKWQVLDVQPKEENTMGIPREVFNAVAVPIERPLSQQ